MNFGGNEGAWTIFGLNIFISLLGLYFFPKLVEKSLFRPHWVIKRKQYASVILSGFSHANINHLLFNMVTFYFFAFPMESVLGTINFVVLYVVGLLGGQLGTWLMQRNNAGYASLGASGAISAVLLAYIVYFPTHSLYLFLIPIPIPAFVVAIAFLAYSWFASKKPASLINHHAHLYGALCGLIFVAFIEPKAYGDLLALFLRYLEH
jgi:membrane associated rhomboid family serine protease